jgi:hypothetical protein
MTPLEIAGGVVAGVGVEAGGLSGEAALPQPSEEDD